MKRNRLIVSLLLLIIVAVFAYGTLTLLIMRFERGDVYPPYSSFRSDPLGTGAFYEALGLLPEINRGRNLEPLTGAALSGATVFFFGSDIHHLSNLSPPAAAVLEDLVTKGGRLVIAFAPTPPVPGKPPAPKPTRKETPGKESGSEKQKKETAGNEEAKAEPNVDLPARWGVETALSNDPAKEARVAGTVRGLPPLVAWPGPLVFTPLDKAWHTVYAKAGKPVLIERSYGKGTIVLSSDSFFVSNEAMRTERHPRLLSWLCGSLRRIIFDETHLGVMESPGVAGLIKKYGLVPFFASILLLVCLALWKEATPFVPAYEEGEDAVMETGKDSLTGLTNLLRRNIPPDEVLTACLEEWKRSFSHGKRDRSHLVAPMEEIIAADHALPKKKRDPVAVYRKISSMLDGGANNGNPG